MKLSAALGVLIFAAALAGVTVPVLLGQPGADGVQSRGMVFSQLEPGEEIQFAVPPTIDRMRISSRLLVPEQEGRDHRRSYDYGVNVSWLDRDGRLVSSRVFHERSRVSWDVDPVDPSDSGDPGDSAQGHDEVTRNATIPGDDRCITDNRVTTIPIRELLPEGGVVKVSASAASYPVLMRGFARTQRKGTDLERAVLAPTRREIEQAVHGSGVPSFDLLNARERRLLLSKQWRADHVPLIGDAPLSRRVQFRATEDQRDQRDVRLKLQPRRSVALNLRGPVSIRISGNAEIQKLNVSVVADVADAADGEQGPFFQESVTTPLGFAGETTARELRIDSAAPFSLQITNPSPSEIWFYASVDDASESHLFGRTVGVPLTHVLLPKENAERSGPSGRKGPDELDLPATVLLIPETLSFTAYRIGPNLPLPVIIGTPGFGPDDTLLIDVRALLYGPDDKAERTFSLIGRNAAGEELYRSSATFAVEAAPFEEVDAPAPRRQRVTPPGLAAPALARDAAAGAQSWLSEPVRLYAPGDTNVVQFELTSPDALVATVRAPGMVHGDATLYPLPQGAARLRYARRPLTEWSRLPPTEPKRLREAGQALTVTANVRLEAPPDLTEEGGEADGRRFYTSLEPSGSGAASGRVWLVAAASESTGSLYCRYGVSKGRQSFVFDAKTLNGELAGVLWTPTAAIGDSYSVTLDETLWRQARARQRVTRIKAVREPRHRTARFKGPKGATLWLRTHGASEACGAPYRALAAHSLAPGKSMTFAVEKTLPEQLVIFGGFGREEASIEVVIDDAVPGKNLRAVRPYRHVAAERNIKLGFEQ